MTADMQREWTVLVNCFSFHTAYTCQFLTSTKSALATPLYTPNAIYIQVLPRNQVEVMAHPPSKGPPTQRPNTYHTRTPSTLYLTTNRTHAHAWVWKNSFAPQVHHLINTCAQNHGSVQTGMQQERPRCSRLKRAGRNGVRPLAVAWRVSGVLVTARRDA